MQIKFTWEVELSGNDFRNMVKPESLPRAQPQSSLIFVLSLLSVTIFFLLVVTNFDCKSLSAGNRLTIDNQEACWAQD